MTVLYADYETDDESRREKLFLGDLFVYRASSATQELCELARRLAEDAFHPFDPETAQFHMQVEDFAKVLAELKPRFIHHERCKALIPRIVESVGGDTDQTYFDVPRLRSSTSDNYLTTGIAYAFHPHRDTWYSAADSQINWWLPIYAIGADCGMAIHPNYFSNIVENTSECYDYYRWNRDSRADAASHIGNDTREQPKAVGEIPLEPDLRVITEPGGMFQFSGAHLHSSIPNQTGKTRFSIDFRTVHREDVAARKGALNVDSECTGTNLRDFLRCSDLSRLPEELVLPYDDGQAPPSGATLTFDANRKD
jgi:hypothetical protein